MPELESTKAVCRQIFFRSGVKCQINYACGYAFSGDYPEASLLDLLNEADLNMYEDKVQSKQGRRN